MELEVKLPQLDEVVAKLDTVVAKLDAVVELLGDVDLTSGCAAHDVDACLSKLHDLDKKLDALAPATAAPDPVQTDLPLVEQPQAAKAKRAPRKAKQAEPAPHVAEADDEDTLRARAEFEGKRVSRMFGISATRAVIKKVAGEDVTLVDDVPTSQLPALLGELQAM